MKMRNLLILLLLLPFTMKAQLANLDFEDWDNSINKPLDWYITSSGMYIDFNSNTSTYFPKETASHSGDYALKLSIWYYYTKDVAYQEASMDSKLDSLSGYYKYENNTHIQIYQGDTGITDTAKVSVYLTHFNVNTQISDTVGVGMQLLSNKTDYTRFNVAIQYSDTVTPDSVMVIIDPSYVKRYEASTNGVSSSINVSSILTVDALQMHNHDEEPSSVNEIDQKANYTVYPNPASDQIQISNFTGQISVFDMSGKCLMNAVQVQENEYVSTSQLTKGTYILQLSSNKEIYHSKLVID